MSEELLDASFLISELVSRLADHNTNTLTKAVDAFRKGNTFSQNLDPSVFEFRWSNLLQNKGNIQQIRVLQKNIKMLTEGLTFPAAIFRILDELCTAHPLKQLSTVPTMIPIQIAEIPYDIIYVLQGMDGNAFRFSQSKKRFVYYENVSPELLEPLKHVNVVGCLVRLLTNFVQSKEGIAHQHVADYVQGVLDRHFEFVASISQCIDKMSVTHFMSLMHSEAITDLRSTGIVCQTVGSTKGCVLFNMLHEISKHGNKSVAKAGANMRDACFLFIKEIIKDWVTKGEVDDPFTEFFVKCDSSVLQCSKWWKDRYFIEQKELPATLSNEECAKVFSAGKALNFLRHWDSPAILNIKCEDFGEFVSRASAEADARMLGFINKDSQLEKAVKDIHDFVLLQRGDFASMVCEMEHESLPRKLERLIQRFSGHVVKEIDIELSERHCQFVYTAVPPLSAVFGETEMMMYKRVSNVLLRLRKVDVLLSKMIHKFVSIQFSIIIYEMLSFVRLVADFMQIHVIRKSYDNLMRVIQTAKTFDEILAAHSTHISNITRGCWMSGSGRECRSTLMDIIELIEASIESGDDLKATRDGFHGGILKLHSALLEHKASGHELARPLMKLFQNVL